LTAIYVHVPFCLQRCNYCDFNTYTGLLSLEDEYVRALLREVALRAERAPDTGAQTLYFGGGTPSLLRVEGLVDVVQAVRHHFKLPWDAEVTLEANPGTLTPSYLSGLRDVGVTRLSLGVQSSHSNELVMLGRLHSWQDAVDSVGMARGAALESISLDLMYALPGQSLAEWLETVDRALALDPDHLSLYALTLEPGTPLAEAFTYHSIELPDGDVAADMYEAAAERLHAHGFWQYEISNWARGSSPAPEIWALPPNGVTEGIGPHISHHNLMYWRNQAWLGLGAGAHSWVRHRRWSNYPHPESYINAMRSERLHGFSDDVVSPAVEWGETMMMGLRLAEGVTDARFYERFRLHLREVYEQAIERVCGLGLASWDGKRLRLTAHGRLLGNQVFQEFLLPEEELLSESPLR
jgi:oxygen-independent coproporphyrinogen III oxidase